MAERLADKLLGVGEAGVAGAEEQKLAWDAFFDAIESISQDEADADQQEAQYFLDLAGDDRILLSSQGIKQVLSLETVWSERGSSLVIHVPPAFYTIVSSSGAMPISEEETSKKARDQVRTIFKSEKFKQVKDSFGVLNER